MQQLIQQKLLILNLSQKEKKSLFNQLKKLLFYIIYIFSSRKIVIKL